MLSKDHPDKVAQISQFCTTNICFHSIINKIQNRTIRKLAKSVLSESVHTEETSSHEYYTYTKCDIKNCFF